MTPRLRNLFGVSLVTLCLRWSLTFVASGGVGRPQNLRAKPPQLEVVDREGMLAQSTFPIAPDELVKICHKVILAGIGTKDPSLLADDFEFAGPVVGPINKEQYLKAVEFALDNIGGAFPDQNAQYYDFRVDPFEPNRVWYTSRGRGTMTGKFAGALDPNGKVMQQPPQTNSMSFNANGKCVEVTAGYVMDRRVGNTNGLGAVYAVFRSMGFPLPYPEGQPWTPSPQFRLFLEATLLADQVSGLFGKPPAKQNPYWRKSTEEINSKPTNRWAVEAKYKNYES
eukprot:TRINITY_DN11620_c0_g1_i4.p1 TRINITY_DN11620_c0_g1~~TRINITY_DN11620_c0_g1_i4.p1  ORF type:complete len:282 (+),score=39.77 TRINITY_DN11620_c0_g1_i4:58-903(+)